MSPRSHLNLYLNRLREGYPDFFETYVNEEDGLVISVYLVIKVAEDLSGYTIRFKDKEYSLGVDEPITFERIDEIKRSLDVDYLTACRIACIASIIRECALEVRRLRKREVKRS